MSRLEEELKLALGRQEPSSDFTDRVMTEIIRCRVESTTRPSLWRKFSEMFRPRAIGWAAVGAVILLAIVIGAMQYRKSAQTPDEQRAATGERRGEPASEQKENRQDDEAQQNPALQKREEPDTKRNNRGPATRPRVRRDTLVAQEGKMSPEEIKAGEEAKRKLLLALQVTSATLNEAQRIVREDRSGMK